ncbi:MAG: hypothetical protein IIB42_05675 [Candidatus Marinimicrobia bacterium]|nr:hypothetical protein [Candidatus Neomarinimicrobiota bacterium]
MNNSTGQLLSRLLMLSLLGFWGCYNNAHLRTQQLLEPGEKVLTGSGVLAVGPGTFYGDLNYTGVSGFRGEVSSLTGTMGGERGPYLGLGLAGVGEGIDLVAGYEIKRYTSLDRAVPWKLGLQGEINYTPGDQPGGFALHLRPSFTSTTARGRPFYGGLHGLFSLGTLKTMVYGEEFTGEYEEYYDEFTGETYRFEIYQGYNEMVNYQSIGFGAGLTLGVEGIFRTTSIQLQVDGSWVRNSFSSRDFTPEYTYPSDFPFVISASVGLNFFQPPAVSRRLSRPTRRPAPARAPRFQTAPPPPKQQEFDPVTGEPLGQKAKPKIDPDTGLPLEPDSAAPPPVRIDPDTGLPMAPEAEKPPQLQFDPATGEPVPAEPAPMSGPLVVAGTAPVLTTQQVSSLARAEAQRRHIGGAWAAGGGLLGCGGMFLGGVLGGNLLGFPGFLIGAGVGAIGASEMMAASVTEVPLPVELEAATPELQETYRQAYVSRTRALRRSSIYSAF